MTTTTGSDNGCEWRSYFSPLLVLFTIGIILSIVGFIIDIPTMSGLGLIALLLGYSEFVVAREMSVMKTLIAMAYRDSREGQERITEQYEKFRQAQDKLTTLLHVLDSAIKPEEKAPNYTMGNVDEQPERE